MDLKHRGMRREVCTKPKQKKRSKFEEREWEEKSAQNQNKRKQITPNSLKVLWKSKSFSFQLGWRIPSSKTAWNAKEREFASGKLKKENLHLGNYYNEGVRLAVEESPKQRVIWRMKLLEISTIHNKLRLEVFFILFLFSIFSWTLFCFSWILFSFSWTLFRNMYTNWNK